MSNGKMRAHMQPTGNRHEVAVVLGAGAEEGAAEGGIAVPVGVPIAVAVGAEEIESQPTQLETFAYLTVFLFLQPTLLKTLLLSAASSCLPQPLRTTQQSRRQRRRCADAAAFHFSTVNGKWRHLSFFLSFFLFLFLSLPLFLLLCLL